MCRLPGKNSTFSDSAHKELKLLQAFYLKVLLCTLLPHITQNNVSFSKHSILAHINISLDSYKQFLYLTDVTTKLCFAVHDTGAISFKGEERTCISKRRDKDELNNSHHTQVLKFYDLTVHYLEICHLCSGSAHVLCSMKLRMIAQGVLTKIQTGKLKISTIYFHQLLTAPHRQDRALSTCS